MYRQLNFCGLAVSLFDKTVKKWLNNYIQRSERNESYV